MSENTGIRAAFVLSGCGYLDGTEINESVLLSLACAQHDIQVDFFSIDEMIPVSSYSLSNDVQHKHSGTDARNMFEESGRIARKEVFQMKTLSVDDYDVLVFPGGYGVVNNFSNFFSENDDIKGALDVVSEKVLDFFKNNKAIVAVCIAPVTVALVLKSHVQNLDVTIGKDENGILRSMGIDNHSCLSDSFVYDAKNNIYTSPAFMESEDLSVIYKGIYAMISEVKSGVR